MHWFLLRLFRFCYLLPWRYTKLTCDFLSPMPRLRCRYLQACLRERCSLFVCVGEKSTSYRISQRYLHSVLEHNHLSGHEVFNRICSAHAVINSLDLRIWGCRYCAGQTSGSPSHLCFLSYCKMVTSARSFAAQFLMLSPVDLILWRDPCLSCKHLQIFILCR